MATVADIIQEKGRGVFVIGPDETVYEAIERMVALNVGALLVVAAGVPCGIITERDYLRRVILQGRRSHTTAVKDIMSPSLLSVDRTTPVDECMSLMTERRIRHLPVIEDGDLVGLISIGDVVKHKLREQHSEIRSLTDYIQGTAVGIYGGR